MKGKVKNVVIRITVFLATGMIAVAGFGSISRADDSSSNNGIVIYKGGYVLLNSDNIQYVTVYDGVIYKVVKAESGIKLIIDGQQVSFSKTDGLGVPFIENDRTMVPLRKPLEAIGATVNYDAATRTVIIKKDNTEISIVVDGGMYVNGSAFYQVVAPTAPTVIKDGRVYIPIRNVFEVLGYSLSWDKETQTVTVNKTGLPISTVKGWSVPSYAVGAAGLGMSGDVGVITSFCSYDKDISLSDPDQINKLNTVTIGLRNFSEEKAIWLNSIALEYQVYKNENGKEVLVYQKSFPTFEGTLPAQSGSSTELEVSYWNSEATAPGEYTIKLKHPEFFIGIDKESNEEVKIPIDDNIFGETVVIKVNKN